MKKTTNHRWKNSKNRINRDSIMSRNAGRPNISRMSLLPKLTYWFSVIPVKVPISYFMDIDRLIIWRGKRPRRVNTILKENKVGVLTLASFKSSNKATIIKTLWDWWKNRQVDNETEQRVEVHPHKYSQLIFDKRTKAIQWRKESLTNDAGTLDIQMQR